MNKEVCFFFPIPVTERDLGRFGIDVFQRRGFSVFILEMVQVVYPNYPKGVREKPNPTNRTVSTAVSVEEVRQFVSQHRHGIAILVLTLEDKTRFFYELLKQYKVDYLQFYSNNIPIPSLVSRIKQKIKLQTPFLAMLVHMARGWVKRFSVSSRGLQAPLYLLKAGEQFTLNCPSPDQNTQIIMAHTLDYDLFLKTPINKTIAPTCSVYLDEFFPFHPDLVLEGETLPFLDPKRYYERLNLFFSKVEQHLGLPVVVAAHPRSNYDNMPDIFQGRRIVYGQTIDLVAQAKCALNHFSTSIGFAVLLRKPIIFLTSDEIKTKRHDSSISAFAHQFKKTVVNIDEEFPDSLSDQLRVDEHLYVNYEKKFIKVPGTQEKPSWEIVADHFECDRYAKGGPR